MYRNWTGPFRFGTLTMPKWREGINSEEAEMGHWPYNCGHDKYLGICNRAPKKYPLSWLGR